MRNHYKSDLHRFNLKRKAANLPPVPEDLYDQKVEALKNPKQETKGKKHLKEGKERKVKKVVTTIAPTQTDEDRLDEKIKNAPKLDSTFCLFDSNKSETILDNINYMSNKYGFYFPEIDMLKDVELIMMYLIEKISIGNTCIWCDKSFYSHTAVQSHMRDADHCRMQWEFPEEYEDFYVVPEDPTYFENLDEDGAFVESDNRYVDQTGELVLVNQGVRKTIGNRHLNVYYKQAPRSEASRQLITSLLQEHKRLAAREYQMKVKVDMKTYQNQEKQRYRINVVNNSQKHFRLQNPVL